MNRRKFLQSILPMAATPLMLDGIPLQFMNQFMMPPGISCEEVNDRILVLIQLHGGNDGLNALVPVDQYSTYASLRPTLKIPDTGARSYTNLDSSLPLADQVGVHPDFMALKALYDQGLVNIVQGVGYPNNNKSHFKATDDWLTGSDASNPYSSGWIGRYLDEAYPGFPAGYPSKNMPDPPGLELGSRSLSLGFHRDSGGANGIALDGDPAKFANLVSRVGGMLPQHLQNSHYADKVEFLASVEALSDGYAQRITQVYNKGSNSPQATYPATHYSFGRYQENKLSPQLKTVARLISGGCRTKVYLTRLIGFDTHANQIAGASNPTMGEHAMLLYNLSEAVKAFQEDLAAQGLSDRVLTLTFSEFGRRAAENGSLGTDHGTLAPMFFFGTGVRPGITGTNPDLSNLYRGDLTGQQFDYRQVFATVLQDWLGLSDAGLGDVHFDTFKVPKVPILDPKAIVPAKCYSVIPSTRGLKDFQIYARKGQRVGISWVAGQDPALKMFSVERSENGREFETLVDLPPGQDESYEWEDAHPLPGRSYYRLKQTWKDGRTETTPTVLFRLSGLPSGENFHAYPNPAKGNFTLNVPSPEDSLLTVQLMALTGAVVREFQFPLEAGDNYLLVEAGELSAATYLVKASRPDGWVKTYKQILK